jgi:hypothetical protein
MLTLPKMNCTDLAPKPGQHFVITAESANSPVKNLNHPSIELWYGIAHGVQDGHHIQKFMV